MPVVWAGVCLACLVLSGCSKSGDADEFPPMDFEGVKVDTPRLAKEFQEAAPQLQQRVNNAVTKVRYKQYLQAMMELDEVLKDPGLNDKQKKLISQVINQLKELVAKNPPRPA
jgi:hypothetical protein